MPFNFDPTTDRGKVRLLIPDVEETHAAFDDAAIDAFLGLEDGDVRRATATALETLASSEALIQKRIRTLDLSTDGPAVAKELRERAATLREESDAGGAFGVIEMVHGPFARSHHLRK